MTQAPQKQLHHITPFKGFNSSGSQNLNLLMADSHIYLMDNHRAALWAWLQHIDLSKKYNLLHVDAHDDLSMSEVSHSKDEAEAIHSMNIEAYCEVPSKYESEDLGLTSREFLYHFLS